MKNTKKNPCQIAAANLSAEFPKHYNCFAQSFGLEHSAATKFDHLIPNKSATLFVLNFIRNNPNTTPTKIRISYRLLKNKTISNNLFQNLRWAKLITSRKYNLTELGQNLLKYYNI